VDVLGQLTGVDTTGKSQRPPEGAAPLCQREAGRIGMQVRSPTWQTTGRIGLEAHITLASDRDDPQ